VTRKPIHIEVAMPSGPAHYWREMQARPKGFTIREIALCADGIAYTTVKRYVWFLVRQGYVVRIGQKRDGYAQQAVYVVRKRQTKPPIERPDPQRAPLTAREAMWNAMRALDQFTARELCVSASTEERPVSQRSANLYIQKLVAVGVLQVLEPPQKALGKAGDTPLGATAGRYRLTKSANTGPLAPKLCVAGFVFDPNISRVLGDAVVSELHA
jgi:hypothetical protein